MALNAKRLNKTKADLLIEEQYNQESVNAAQEAISRLNSSLQEDTDIPPVSSPSIIPDPPRQPVPLKEEPSAYEYTKPKVKKSPGRPTFESLGYEKRERYSITLLESLHSSAIIAARKQNLSLSRFIEEALKEYIKHTI